MKNINNFKKSDTRKIQLTVAINFISSKDTDKKHVMYSKSDNIEFMIYDNEKTILDLYKIWLETLIKVSDFNFDCVYLLCYKCHKINPHCGGSYMYSPDWIKNKKATRSCINKNDNKCSKFTATLTLIHKEIRKIQEE